MAKGKTKRLVLAKLCLFNITSMLYYVLHVRLMERRRFLKRLHGEKEEAADSKTEAEPDPVSLLSVHACASL